MAREAARWICPALTSRMGNRSLPARAFPWPRSCVRVTTRRSTSPWPSWRRRAYAGDAGADPDLLRRAALQRRTTPPAAAAGCALERLGVKTLRRFRRPPCRDHLSRLTGRPARARHGHLDGRTAWSSSPRPGRGGVLVLGAPRDAQAAAWHPPRTPERGAAGRAGHDAGVDPGAAAACRQHRHGGARHGQLRPGGAAAGRAARRLAQREGAHCRLRRQLHHRWRAGLSDARGGPGRPQLGLRHHRPPARSGQAGAHARAGGGGNAAAASARASAAASCSGRSATVWRRRRSPTRTRS